MPWVCELRGPWVLSKGWQPGGRGGQGHGSPTPTGAYISPTQGGTESFLEQLLWCIPEKLLVIWDGAPIHRGQPVKDFLASGAAGRIHLEQLPGYAPELNPAEGIWGYLKRVGLKNLCCQNIPHLRVELRRAKERLRHKVDFIKQPGFY